MSSTNEYIAKKRMIFIFLMFLIVFLLFGGRLFYVQIVKGAEYSQKAEGNRTESASVAAKRGTIFDRKGNELAVSTTAQSLHAVPTEFKNQDSINKAAKILALNLNMDEDSIKQTLSSDKSFAYIKRQMEPDLAAKIDQELKDAKIEGLYFTPESKRYYPHNTLASQVLGICGVDNNGLEGIEFYYDKLIGGQAGEIVIEKDGKGTQLPQSTHSYKAPVEGTDVILTIDSTIQYIVEEQLDKVYNEQKANKAIAIVMDPRTGEILAMSSRPTYNPNEYSAAPVENRRNSAISDVYEPGSTMKVCTAAAALQEGLFNRDSHFFCPGYVDIGDKVIKCAHSNAHGDQTFAQILENSCNVGFVAVGQGLGLERYYAYMDKFGFGHRTGIDLPGEADGLIIPRESARKLDLATMSIGQANASTPLQVINAISSIANGGMVVKPHLLKSVKGEDGQWQEKDYSADQQQVVSKATADTLLSILEGEVDHGTGQNAIMEGYRVGGKTGTAQKVGPDGQYMANEFIVSFIGLAPISNPRLVCLVVVDNPKGELVTGGDIAAPVVREILKQSFDYMQVPYDKALSTPDSPGADSGLVRVPDMIALSKDDATQLLANKGLKAVYEGSGNLVWKQNIAADQKVGPGSSVVLYLASVDGSSGQSVVPDFTGKSIKRCAALAVQLGLTLVPSGSGLAAEQNPAAGTIISRDSRVNVSFEAE